MIVRRTVSAAAKLNLHAVERERATIKIAIIDLKWTGQN